MKKPVILLALCYVLFFNHIANAQTNFEETYKKASGFTTTNTDSALFWANKCVYLAETPKQKYQAYYFLAFNASRNCLFGLAQISYKNAIPFATDSMSKYDAINSLADTYLSNGNFKKAIIYNQQSINYFKQTEEFNSLSYAYQLKARILRQQKSYDAIGFLRKAIELRLQHAPKEVGYAYHRLAETFHTFNLLDSAIIYQQRTLPTFPIKTPDKQAFLNIQLAKYYVLNNQAALALPRLHTARGLQKRPLTQAMGCHAQALYYSKTGQTNQALQEFARCDSIIAALLTQAPDIVTKQTIARQARLLYEDALKLEQLPDIVRVRYEGRLETTQVRLAGYRNQLQLKDRLQRQQLGEAPPQATPPERMPLPPSRDYTWYWFTGAALLLLLLWQIQRWWQQTRAKAGIPPPSEAQQLAEGENQLIATLQKKLGAALDKDLYYLVIVYYREGSVTATARLLRISRNTVKSWFKKLSEDTKIDSVKDMIDEARKKVKKDEKK